MKSIHQINPSTVDAVAEKYEKLGQDPEVYMQGLLYAKPITYWDYCEVDTLLSLQKTRTNIPDEGIFIMYHQVNELLFKMILSETEQIAYRENLDKKFFAERLGRISRYFDILSSSFNIMTDGMEVEQYMKFRNSLTPASGFQSAQYRMIEISSTDLTQLIDPRFRNEITGDTSWEDKFERIYWQAAGKDFKTGKKSLTLELFEEKYLKQFIELAKEYENKNLWARFRSLPQEDQLDDELIKAMRHLDYTINIKWVMAHYSTAKKYLDSGETNAEATGGSKWKKYMHPKYQKRIFFPKLWSDEEIENWGITNI